MKYAVMFAFLFALAMLASTPAVAEGQTSCKAYLPGGGAEPGAILARRYERRAEEVVGEHRTQKVSRPLLGWICFVE